MSCRMPATAAANAPSPAAGRKPASNVVERTHHGCVLLENWDDGVGGTGQSFNIYDRTQKRWHQTWVDSNGGLHQYEGELKDGNMVFIGRSTAAAGIALSGTTHDSLVVHPDGTGQGPPVF